MIIFWSAHFRIRRAAYLKVSSNVYLFTFNYFKFSNLNKTFFPTGGTKRHAHFQFDIQTS